MPIADDITLQKPMVLILPGGSAISGSASGSDIGFGTISAIYDTSDLFSVGDSVMYSGVGQSVVSYNNIAYILVEEKNIFNKEDAPA